MSDTDGSSRAAHSARAKGQDKTLLKRISAFFGGNDRLDEQVGDLPQTSEQKNSFLATPSVTNLGRLRVEDVAIPKSEIWSVPDTITADELVQKFRECGLSRLPVYSGTLDTPLGFVHLKDFFLDTHDRTQDFNVTSLLRPLLYVPSSMMIGVLLTKMQSDRIHMALVIDEYGGVDGLLTIEDLIEQVVGQIEDEHDDEDSALWVQEGPAEYNVQSKADLAEFSDEIGVNLSDAPDVDADEIDSVGGLVFMLAGRVPARGEVIRHPLGPEFEVIDADPRRIKRLRVRLSGAALVAE